MDVNMVMLYTIYSAIPSKPLFINLPIMIHLFFFLFKSSLFTLDCRNYLS